MLISVHTPKTGGRSFEKNLRDVYGSRAFIHANDWVEVRTDEASERSERHGALVRADPAAFAQRYDAVHGHFRARKYLALFPGARLVTFVRDPFQHAISSYEYGKRIPPTQHPGHIQFKSRYTSMHEVLERYPDHQSMYVDGLPVEAFAMIGIFERYDESLALFEALFGVTIPDRATRLNANPDRTGDAYDVPADVRRDVERFRAGDLELYRRAVERFERQCAAHLR